MTNELATTERGARPANRGERRVVPERGEAVFEALLDRILTHEAKVAVVGLGYVGLPLAKLFASKGFSVTGFDVDRNKISQLNLGRSYIKSVPSESIAEFLDRKTFAATTDFARLGQADAVIICVPTPLTSEGKPDVSSIKATAQAIGRALRKGQLVVLESTSYPGTTREIMKPELEKSGLKCGR